MRRGGNRVYKVQSNGCTARLTMEGRRTGAQGATQCPLRLSQSTVLSEVRIATYRLILRAKETDQRNEVDILRGTARAQRPVEN